MTKEIIIIALIVLVIYLYYQQNNQSVDKRSYDNLIQDLKRQVQHYQTLYQRRVEEDVNKLNNREEKETQTDLSEQKKKDWNQEKKNYEQRLLANKQEFDKWIKVKQDDDRNFKEQITNKNQQISQLKDNQTNLRQSLNDLQEQNKELITEKGKLTQELQAKNNWGSDNLPQLKKELSNSFILSYQELKNQINKATIAWGRKEVEEKLEKLEDFFDNQTQSKKHD